MPAIPENEARNLINSMETCQKFVLEGEEQYFCHAHLNLLDIRNSMLIESEGQDIYVDILYQLLDESIQFNDSKQVMKARKIQIYISPGNLRLVVSGEYRKVQVNL